MTPGQGRPSTLDAAWMAIAEARLADYLRPRDWLAELPGT